MSASFRWLQIDTETVTRSAEQINGAVTPSLAIYTVIGGASGRRPCWMAKEASAGPVGDADLGVHVLDMVAHRFGESPAEQRSPCLTRRARRPAPASPHSRHNHVR